MSKKERGGTDKSPTQFNREYKRMFGNPPLKDIRNILAYAS